MLDNLEHLQRVCRPHLWVSPHDTVPATISLTVLATRGSRVSLRRADSILVVPLCRSTIDYLVGYFLFQKVSTRTA